MIIDQFFISNKSKYYENTDAMKANDKAKDKAKRSIVKSISWRLIGTLDTIIISWFITGEVAMALTIGSIEIVTKMLLYFFHERIWNIIKWGKQ